MLMQLQVISSQTSQIVCSGMGHRSTDMSASLPCRELAQLNQVASRKLEFVAMLKQEAATRERQVLV